MLVIVLFGRNFGQFVPWRTWARIVRTICSLGSHPLIPLIHVSNLSPHVLFPQNVNILPPLLTTHRPVLLFSTEGQDIPSDSWWSSTLPAPSARSPGWIVCIWPRWPSVSASLKTGFTRGNLYLKMAGLHCYSGRPGDSSCKLPSASPLSATVIPHASLLISWWASVAHNAAFKRTMCITLLISAYRWREAGRQFGVSKTATALCVSRTSLAWLLAKVVRVCRGVEWLRHFLWGVSHLLIMEGPDSAMADVSCHHLS